MPDCIFCKIIAGEIPSTVVYENEKILAFEDINPMAPVHVLIVPKEHRDTLMDVTPNDISLMQEIFIAVQEVARIKNIDQSGFRTVINCREEGGQLVFHLHVHLLGGVKLCDNLG